MFKRFTLAVVPMLMLAGSVMGEDDLLSKIGGMDVDSIEGASAEVEEFDLAGVDVDTLLGDEDEGEEDAIAACFRRIGYGYGYGYGYGNRHFSYGYNNCYRPYYTSYRTYSYYRPLYCYQPVHYTTYTPVYTSYWGCY